MTLNLMLLTNTRRYIEKTIEPSAQGWREDASGQFIIFWWLVITVNNMGRFHCAPVPLRAGNVRAMGPERITHDTHLKSYYKYFFRASQKVHNETDLRRGGGAFAGRTRTDC